MDKANVLETSRFWRKIVFDLGAAELKSVLEAGYGTSDLQAANTVKCSEMGDLVAWKVGEMATKEVEVA